MSAMLMMQPFVNLSCGATAWARNSGALRLVSSSSLYVSSSIAPSGVAKNPEALLTRTSMRMNVSLTDATISSIADLSRRSASKSCTLAGRVALSSSRKRLASSRRSGSAKRCSYLSRAGNARSPRRFGRALPLMRATFDCRESGSLCMGFPRWVGTDTGRL